MNKIIIVNKEKGMTSRDVVNELVHFFHMRKIGHTGTLDPLATGVLVITLGKYTKLGDVLVNDEKEYIAKMQLGITTDTLDIEGKVLKSTECNLTEEQISKAIMSFQKRYYQEVPLYSAVKVKGKKLYEYARNNEEVTLPKKEVNIKKIEILAIDNNIVQFKVLVSKGTYIRSLIRDIGDYLKVGATMLELVRTRQGMFNINDAYYLRDIKNNNFAFLDVEDVLDLEVLDNFSELKKIENGVKIKYSSTKPYLLFKENGENVALYQKQEDYYTMFIKY